MHVEHQAPRQSSQPQKVTGAELHATAFVALGVMAISYYKRTNLCARIQLKAHGPDQRTVPGQFDCGYVALCRELQNKPSQDLSNVKKATKRRLFKGFGEPPAWAQSVRPAPATKSDGALLRAADVPVKIVSPVSPSVGSVGAATWFDPVNLRKAGAEEGSDLRSAEVKLGRVAVIFALADMVQYDWKMPSLDGGPTDLSALPSAPGAILAFLLLTGSLEYEDWRQVHGRKPDHVGNPTGFGLYRKEISQMEINGGRLGILTAIGTVAAELLTSNGVMPFGL